MKIKKLVLLSLLLLIPISLGSIITTQAQNQASALERGYRTGYSDGYNSGFSDVSAHAPRDFKNKDDYQQAERSYNEAWGSVDDYRDGYQQGFEAGYAAGYDRQLFNSTIPVGLKRRGTSDAAASVQVEPAKQDQNIPVGPPQTTTSGDRTIFISRDTILLVELLNGLSTEATQQGDRFQARVIEPNEFQGAIVEGRVSSVKRPGKVKGVAELQLNFDTIRMPDNRTSKFDAELVEVVQMGSSDGVGTVDSEGGVRGKDSTKDDVSKVGAATGIGAIIGAIAGGGKGAAIGAAIGGGVGTGSVMSQRGKDIHLDRGQQLRIRSVTESKIEARS